MLMLVDQDDNPLTPQAAITNPVDISQETPPPPPMTSLPPQPATFTPPPTPPPNVPGMVTVGGKKPSNALKIVGYFVVLLLIAGAGYGGFYLGKHHQKIVYRAPTPQPVNLPPTAIKLTDCVAGRGKQYIIPQDIPTGPIYDVENQKVIAVEYHLNIESLFSNSDTFSKAILNSVKNYPVDHLSILPATTTTATSAASLTPAQQAAAASQAENIHLIMFVVPKAEASAITCSASSSASTSTSTTTTKTP